MSLNPLTLSHPAEPAGLAQTFGGLLLFNQTVTTYPGALLQIDPFIESHIASDESGPVGLIVNKCTVGVHDTGDVVGHPPPVVKHGGLVVSLGTTQLLTLNSRITPS